MSMEASVEAVESILNYKFNNKKLLEEALTHSSYTGGPSYQRLEFLGDSVLGAVISIFFFLTYPDVDPGRLSDLRARNVSTERLARVAVRHEFYKYIRHNKASVPVLNDKVSEFITAVDEEEEVVMHGGLMKPPKILVDIVESVIGAVSVNCGFNLQILWIISRRLLEPLVMLDDVLAQPQPVSALYEACQRDGKQVDIRYSWNGDKNIASVFVDNTFIAFGSSETKENAKLHAAKAALSKLTKSTGSRETRLEKIAHTYGVEMSMEGPVAAVESILRYKFEDKKLLEEALTHSSYTGGPSYQRLEFLGDSILGVVISIFFFLTYPDVDPGRLTDLRARNVSTERLARVAVRHKLYKYIRHNKANAPLLNDKVSEFISAVEEEEDLVVHGGRMKPPKVLVDIIESVAGAVFVDCGFNLQMLWIIFRRLLEPLVMLDVILAQPQPISALYEACQKDGKQVDIRYAWNGDSNIASVFVDDTFIASGSSETKENAKLHAAEAALLKLTKSKSDDASSQSNDDFNESMETEDAKKHLYELCNKKRWPNPTYRGEQEWGPAHDKRFVSSVNVEVSDKILFVKGNASSRVKEAENSAASKMLCALRKSKYA